MSKTAKLTEAQITEVLTSKDAYSAREEIISAQLTAKKLVTNAATGLLLKYETFKEYKKDGKVESVQLKYKEYFTNTFYSLSLKDLLNTLRVDGAPIAVQITYIEGSWSVPDLIYISDAKESADKDKEYPLVAYKGYRQSIFTTLEGEALSKEIEKIRNPRKLRPNSKAFLKEINVITDKTKIPVLI